MSTMTPKLVVFTVTVGTPQDTPDNAAEEDGKHDRLHVCQGLFLSFVFSVFLWPCSSLDLVLGVVPLLCVYPCSTGLV